MFFSLALVVYPDVFVVSYLYIQCIWKVFRPLDFFHILLCYSLILKWMNLFFSLINIHIYHDDKVDRFIEKKRIQTLCHSDPKPLLHCLGCVVRVVVLLEDEPSPQSEVLSAMEQVFIKDLSVLCSVHLCLDCD